ncbi:MAG: hypothetical protein EA385_14945 [Salinarimonadaceae bacterium]|nr:MAG: hypothetical protein EA385_14945 [Salinarimonadaceae bacterium]
MPDNEPKFSELPIETQRFLRDLRPEDIGLLSEGMRLAKATLTIGKFFKWTLVTILGAFVGMAMLGDSIVKVKDQFSKLMGWG